MCILCGAGSALSDALAPAILALAVILPWEIYVRIRDYLGGRRCKTRALAP